MSQKEEVTMKLIQLLKNFVREEDGAAAIEYGLIAALIAAMSDVRKRRIPNWVVGGAMFCGLVLQATVPAGEGLFSFWWGAIGILPALLGMLAGLALFMPLHLLRIVGAGDVKLLAMVG